MKSELDPGSAWPLAPAASMGAEGGQDLLTGVAAGSPEQLLSLFPFTSGYDIPAAWLVFRRGLCPGNPGWQMFCFVSDRRAAAVVWPCWQFYWLLYHFYPCSPCSKPWRGGLPLSFWVHSIPKFLQILLHSLLIAYTHVIFLDGLGINQIKVSFPHSPFFSCVGFVFPPYVFLPLAILLLFA